MNRTIKFLLLLVCMFNVGCGQAETKLPITKTISTEEEFWKYHSSSGSSDIKFSKDDYFGTWNTKSNKQYDFMFNSDFTFEIGDRYGKCETLEQGNNTLLMKCFGEFYGEKEEFRYVRLQIFYFAQTKETANLHLNITINQDIDCARKGDSDSRDCFHNGQDISFDMYYKN